jgi:signal transduction histidine kinase
MVMTGFFRRRLQLQLLLILLAAVSVAALSVLLISDSIRNAEQGVIADIGKQLDAAISELGQQYSDRTTSDSTWPNLPPSTQDVSLRAISQAVLRSYPGVEGGYYVGTQFIGYSFPTHDNPAAKTDVPSAERSVIQEVAGRAESNGKAEQLLRGGNDLVLIRATSMPQGAGIAWAMQRRSRVPTSGGRRALLVALVIAALLSVGGTLQMGIALRRGVRQIQGGLATLEKDFGYSLHEGSDELGEISRSINRMASVRRRLEDELRREDRLRAIGRTVAGIAHEIRNPLNGIRLSMQLLAKRLKRGSVLPEDLGLVIAEVDRMDALLNDLLAFREKKQVALVEQNLLPVIEKCVHLVQPQEEGTKKIRVHVQRGDAALRARIDSQRLTQALMNLLLNAVEATEQYGEVEVTVHAENGAIAIEVRDSGPGLTEEQQKHLFEAFYTTKPDGTGLGLAVSREFVEEMGGKLTYKNSSPGATFVVELPVVMNA